MNKRSFLYLTGMAALAAALTIAAPAVSAQSVSSGIPVISPALTHIAASRQVVKSSYDGRAVAFEAEDFDSVIGAEIDSVTILTLPAAESGTLSFGGSAVSRGDTIPRSELDELVFSPAPDGPEANFRFGAAGNQAYSMSCTLYSLDELNFAPSAMILGGGSTPSISTPESLAYYGSMRAADPEGDPISYRVMSYPVRGTLALTDSVSGSYCYTPENGYVGGDSFEYVAVDRYGGVSEVITVSIDVTKAGGIEFADLDGHWCGAAAVKAVSAGYMSGVSVGGMNVFDPSGSVVRGEFLAMIMDAAGLGGAESVSDIAVFADFEDIPAYYRDSVAAALDLGIITASGEGGMFNPTADITRAEAAVMIARSLEATVGKDVLPVYRRTFADDADIPSWAYGAIGMLGTLGVLSGDSDGCVRPGAALTRAEAAQMVMAAEEMCGMNK